MTQAQVSYDTDSHNENSTFTLNSPHDISLPYYYTQQYTQEETPLTLQYILPLTKDCIKVVFI